MYEWICVFKNGQTSGTDEESGHISKWAGKTLSDHRN
jgi:hypothetical protein